MSCYLAVGECFGCWLLVGLVANVIVYVGSSSTAPGVGIFHSTARMSSRVPKVVVAPGQVGYSVGFQKVRRM